jgi:hypothetical protein
LATLVAGLAAGLLALASCASNAAKKSAQAAGEEEAVAESNAQLPRFRIRDFSVKNDHTLIVIADDGTRYRAETLGPCIGLSFATRLAFVNRGGFEQVDRFSSVVLDDGSRCALQTFEKLKPAATQALDRYEKSQEAKPADEKPAESPSNSA